MRLAAATRASNDAMSLAPSLSGLPGETSHQTSSRRSECIASRLMRRCPECAGLNDPPRSPIRAIPLRYSQFHLDGSAAPGLLCLHRESRRSGSVTRQHYDSLIALQNVVDRVGYLAGPPRYMPHTWADISPILADYRVKFIRVIRVNPKNTSNLCSRCERLTHSRIGDDFCCDHCGHTIDRDQNAALNILGRGIVLPVTAAA